MPRTQTDQQTSEEIDIAVDTLEPFCLVVWNDEVNTFEWVIETLVQVCNQSQEQAEQCAYIIHFRGKYAVRQGNYDELKPLCDAITERGIGATLELVPA
jgi:ATP-dependent Clp protease adaptor protein ClpS